MQFSQHFQVTKLILLVLLLTASYESWHPMHHPSTQGNPPSLLGRSNSLHIVITNCHHQIAIIKLPSSNCHHQIAVIIRILHCGWTTTRPYRASFPGSPGTINAHIPERGSLGTRLDHIRVQRAVRRSWDELSMVHL